MKKSSVLLLAALLLAIAAQLPAQVKQGKTRPLTTKQWMRGVIGSTCLNLQNGLQDSGPADDQAWEKVAQNAAILNESSYVLMDDGRCPDDIWAEATKKLRESSDAILKASAAKDAKAAQAAFSGVLQACGTCHMVHKNKK